MSRRDPWVSLRQMYDHAVEAKQFATGRTREDFGRDRMFYLSTVRLLEVVGEAANRIPRDFQQGVPDVPWGNLIALRNRIIHGYDTIDQQRLWETLQADLDPLILALRKALRSAPKPLQVDLFDEELD